VVSQIAGEHGLEPVVADVLSGQGVAHEDQTGESDIHFLTRLAYAYGGMAKPTFSKLLFVEPAQAVSATGQPLEPVSIAYGSVSTYSLKLLERARYNSVKAFWQDVEGAELKVVVSGEGEPAYEIASTFPSETEAQAAVDGALDYFTRGKSELSITLPGNPQILAETPLTLENWPREEFNREWTAVSVSHSLNSSGLVTSIRAQSN